MPMPRPSFDTVALPHLDAAYNLASWLLCDATEAEDTVQDARLPALKYFSSFSGGDGRAWLLMIVRDTAYDKLAAKHGNWIAISLDHGEDSPPDFLRDPGDDPQTALLRKQVARSLMHG
jgi:RNA polymerase sigma-70 factor, ECF subfamily